VAAGGLDMTGLEMELRRDPFGSSRFWESSFAPFLLSSTVHSDDIGNYRLPVVDRLDEF